MYNNSINMTTTLVTGAAGFVGFHLTNQLLKTGTTVVGVDNCNDYYDVGLKQARLDQLSQHKAFQFSKLDLADRADVETLFKQTQPETVVHLAAQAGVRYSLSHPHAYVDSNLVGFTNVLEGCRGQAVKHFVYASSSSVYGANTKIPFSTHDRTDYPVSLYAATKRANELMAFTYSHLYGIPTTGLRFFTVYGPWGRPDMAYFKFTKAILAGQSIPVFNQGKMRRDFTYIDDIVEGITQIIKRIPHKEKPEFSTAQAPYKLYNIGNHQPINLIDFITTLEDCLGIEAQKEMLPMQPGDVVETYADTMDLQADTGFKPNTPLKVGLTNFVDWYRAYYKL